MSIITYPTPLYQNPKIERFFYEPRATVISSISKSRYALVVTDVANNFTVGQQVRFNITKRHGMPQIENKSAYIVDVLDSTQFYIDLDTRNYQAYVSTPDLATITDISKSTNAVVTADNTFLPKDLVKFSDVEGMTEINGLTASIISANGSNFTINLNTNDYTTYSSGGLTTLYKGKSSAYVIPIGDLNSGAINQQYQQQQLFIDGSFINVSPRYS